MAKSLDPSDPTPYFYDAIEKQTTNRPVEALEDMERAIERNDNRAVYRSRLLLDSDLAARSASLGRIYTDLGFQELALTEGWKSVNVDPTNFSAHRFLADSYSALPRHEIARVSELLQSQLLQPINITPVQPRLAESNLFLISAQGPAAASSNEFNPIFNRDGIAVQATGLAGENNTWAGEGVVSGIHGNLSYSLGYTHFATDGWRTNSDQDDQIANAFVQLELTPDTSVQAEYRYRDLEHGDLGLRFFPQDFFPGERTTEERHTARIGARHAFSPGSVLLGSFIYQDATFGVQNDQPPAPLPFSSERPEQAYSAELQHLLRSPRFSLTTGAGFFDINGRIDQVIGLGLPPPFPLSITTSTDLNHTNLYAYSYTSLLKNVTLTAGLSADLLNGDSLDVGEKDQINPKLGITWQPQPATTVRAAAFRVLKRTLITDQTLEPTQVAGFNQFFDDANGTDAWRYGAAVDQKLGRNAFAGVEYSARDLKVPYLDFTDPAFPDGKRAEVDWNEQLGRGYLFWTPHRWLALRAQYTYERFDRDAAFAAGVTDLETHRVPLGISFFHPSGFSASLTGTYWNQRGKFEFAVPGVFQPGSDDFWLFDAAINYRLPKRYGLITVGATNLFGTQFQYFGVDFDNPTIQPDRMIFARLTLSLR